MRTFLLALTFFVLTTQQVSANQKIIRSFTVSQVVFGDYVHTAIAITLRFETEETLSAFATMHSTVLISWVKDGEVSGVRYVRAIQNIKKLTLTYSFTTTWDYHPVDVILFNSNALLAEF